MSKYLISTGGQEVTGTNHRFTTLNL